MAKHDTLRRIVLLMVSLPFVPIPILRHFGVLFAMASKNNVFRFGPFGSFYLLGLSGLIFVVVVFELP